MIALCLLTLGLSWAETPADLDTPEPDRLVPSAHRVRGFGGTHGVSLGEQLVLGGDGGTSITTLDARVVADRWTLRLSLPFAAYRLPDRRDTDLGNLRLEVLRTLDTQGAAAHALGLSARANPGGTPWTWATRADEVWPGFGLDGVWESRGALTDTTALLGRASVGLHSSPGFAPIPSTWLRVSASGAVDQSLGSVAGLVGEVTASYWEVAPLEVAGLLRVDPAEGLRLRAGTVLPMFTWFGWAPIDRPGGAREATLALDVQAAF